MKESSLDTDIMFVSNHKSSKGAEPGERLIFESSSSSKAIFLVSRGKWVIDCALDSATARIASLPLISMPQTFKSSLFRVNNDCSDCISPVNARQAGVDTAIKSISKYSGFSSWVNPCFSHLKCTVSGQNHAIFWRLRYFSLIWTMSAPRSRCRREIRDDIVSTSGPYRMVIN